MWCEGIGLTLRKDDSCNRNLAIFFTYSSMMLDTFVNYMKFLRVIHGRQMNCLLFSPLGKSFVEHFPFISKHGLMVVVAYWKAS